MVLRRLLMSVLNNARLIEKLSETPPMRQAARLTVYLLSRLERGGRQAAERLRERADAPRRLSELNKKVTRLRDTWAKELRQRANEARGQKKQK
ncbi:protein NCBP2AS2 [Scyliorhinus canicula]|uniref:protein NCBP2AS2 n=1 Tax=Scyliorhinus canicula TaxID=7830 RepID=UPI0018F690DA|nr:protein NCBP2AS2 [Scyliorhinus canicula]